MKLKMDEKLFGKGYPVETYVEGLHNYRSLVRALLDEANPDRHHVDALSVAAADHLQPVRATMMTEDWCGDSAANTPILARLFEEAGLEFRIFRGSEQSALQKSYEREGATHIPVVSIWDGAGQELARWIEAPGAVQEKKEVWKAEHPQFMELYTRQKTDRAAAREFGSLYRAFLDTMAQWYREGLWSETTREITESLVAKASQGVVHSSNEDDPGQD